MYNIAYLKESLVNHEFLLLVHFVVALSWHHYSNCVLIAIVCFISNTIYLNHLNSLLFIFLNLIGVYLLFSICYLLFSFFVLLFYFIIQNTKNDIYFVKFYIDFYYFNLYGNKFFLSLYTFLWYIYLHNTIFHTFKATLIHQLH